MVRVIQEKSLSQKIRSGLSGFRLFAFLGVMTLVIGLTLYLTTQRQDLRQQASGIESIEYGFNTHLNATGGSGYWENLTLDVFKKTVDDLVANKQQWIRFNIAPWETVTGGSTTQISWNEPAMQKYVEAILYARSKGLKVFIATATPDYANGFSSSDYTLATSNYHKELANRFKGNIAVWQIYNEADVHHFKGYTPIGETEMTPEYLQDLKANFVSAKNAIRAVDPSVLFSSNVSGYPLEQKTFDGWDKYFTVIAPEVDLLGLDIYARSEQDTSNIKTAVIGVATKFSKPTIIAETGFPSGTADSSELLQASVMTLTIEQLRQALPKAIILYQYSDTLPATDRTESTFGVVNVSGSQKQSYKTIMSALSYPTGLLRIETKPSVGATITVTSSATNQVVLTREWGVDWEKFPVGNYRIAFSNPKNLTIFDKKIILPTEQTISIQSNQTTTLIADLTNGTINGVGNPTVVPPTSTPLPTNTPIPTKIPSPSPTNTPTPSNQNGTISITKTPSVNTKIRVIKSSTNQVIAEGLSSITKSLPVGNYYVTFTSAGIRYKTPPLKTFIVNANKNTKIVGNYNYGTTTITYQ